jgi:hypothetical protein
VTTPVALQREIYSLLSASQIGASTKKWDSWFRLGEEEPSFKAFLASPTIICLGLMSIKPDLGRTKLFPACFLRVTPH